eukprot:6407607-Pyramimonas_sp.AAC.1
MHLAQTDSDMQCVVWESLLADPADISVAALNFTAAMHLSANAHLESFADELFEEIFIGHNEIDLADWLACPSRGSLPISSASRTSACPPKEMARWRRRPRMQKHYSCNRGGDAIDASSLGYCQSDKHGIER